MYTFKNRPDRDIGFMCQAIVASYNSTCMRRRTGCVLTVDNRIVAVGYNGNPVNTPHCNFYGPAGCYSDQSNKVPSGDHRGHEICRATHAEQNAIVQAARSGVSAKHCTVYTTNFPCIHCTKLLLNLECQHIYYYEEYNDTASIAMLDDAGVCVERLHSPLLQILSHPLPPEVYIGPMT